MSICLSRISGLSREQRPIGRPNWHRNISRLRHHFQGQKVKGQGHQAALLNAALTRKVAGAVSVGTYSARESTATLRLLGGARGLGRPRGRRGAGAYCVATRTAGYNRHRDLLNPSEENTHLK